jgi:hypothetical protein
MCDPWWDCLWLRYFVKVILIRARRVGLWEGLVIGRQLTTPPRPLEVMVARVAVLLLEKVGARIA